MTLQRQKRILDHFLSQLGFHLHLNKSALSISIPRFKFFCLFFQFINNLNLLVYLVITVDHHHHQHKEQQEIAVMRFDLIPVQEIPLYDIYKG